MDNKKRPLSVSIISILYYVSFVFLLILAILCFFTPSFIISNVNDTGLADQSSILKMLLDASLFIGLMILLISIVGFFIGRGLWKLQNWARIIAVVFACLGILSSVISIIQLNFGSIISLAINLAIGYYLYFDKKTVSAFNKI